MATSKNTVEIKELIHASLGLQASVYDFGKDKLDALVDQAKSNLDDYIARGAKVEKEVVGRIDDFKAQDNLLAKGWSKSEAQAKKVQEQIEDLAGDIADRVKSSRADFTSKYDEFKAKDNFVAKGLVQSEELAEKAQEQMEELFEKAKDLVSFESKPKTKKKAPAKRKAPAKKKAAAKKAA